MGKLLTPDEKRIIELESGLMDILRTKNLETIKTIAAELIGECPEDWVDEEDFLDDADSTDYYDVDELDLNDEFLGDEKYYD